jgi:tripartite-type tricarboxylate transporter receptor subunit TctC
MKTILQWLLPVLACSTSVAAAAQPTPAYPVKPVRWVVPYPAGGPTDLVARVVGQKLAESWGQNVVLDFRGGANSIIGTEMVATAAPDGYTALVALPAFTINPSMYPKLPYDTLRDFVPVSLIGTAPYVLLVNPSLEVRTVKDLLALAKSRQRNLTFGSGGNGSPAHLAMELLKQQADIAMLHVSYKGGAPALVDLAGGQIDVMVNPAASSMPLSKAGKVRVLAITSLTRSATLPEVPTVAESGLPRYSFSTWYGVFLPAKTSSSIIDRVAAGVEGARSDTGVKRRLLSADIEPATGTRGEFTQFVKEELQRWHRVVSAAGLRIER